MIERSKSIKVILRVGNLIIRDTELNGINLFGWPVVLALNRYL